MHTHEYQAKELLKRYEIEVPPYEVASTAEELAAAVDKLGLTEGVLKIQVHAGGRGKVGGVVCSHSRKELIEKGALLFGMKVVNQQTGPLGLVADKIIITPVVRYLKEGYLAIAIDRKRHCPIILASPEGGVEIEALSHERLLTLPLPQGAVLRNYHHLTIAKAMGWHGLTAKKGRQLVEKLLRAFIESDSLLLEINPLVELEGGDLVALDAKWTVDGDALFRHSDYQILFDPSQLTREEVAARPHGLSYVSLKGDIGCMVNGAGLAMATMDIIHHRGGAPANFLDVGGGASVEKVAAGFSLLLADSSVKAILINIFGGIMNCATLAHGIIAATAKQKLQLPIVVRMEGTNVDEGLSLLNNSRLPIQLASDLNDAATKVVAAARGV